MRHKGGIRAALGCAFLFGIWGQFGLSSQVSAAPFLEHAPLPKTPTFVDAEVTPVVVFGRNSRRSVEDFAAEQKLDAVELRRKFTASGLIECGAAHGAGQLTLTDDIVTTAAHVFFDERGAPRARTCFFVIESDGKQIRTPIDSGSIVAGSTNPYAIEAVHDWAVARLKHPVDGVTPYGLAEAERPNMPVEFVARGHIDWGEGRRLSMEKCALRDQLTVGAEGTREFSFDCETGDGASGGAVIIGSGDPVVGAILVGWRSNKPFRSAPFSTTHYNFAVTIEGAFKKAVMAAAAKVVVSK
ncbi:trypsin-like serine protease [Methylocapsa acidiphila]|uniref:trypsin-like serine protease n=1 Tax=Methylocapsa acidiphila TaxID=133552 RepID=UPI0004028F5C|nr:trypsin-like serine protease [Methylocapsa acidiphila]